LPRAGLAGGPTVLLEAGVTGGGDGGEWLGREPAQVDVELASRADRRCQGGYNCGGGPGGADTPARRRSAVLGDPCTPPDQQGDTAALRAAAAEASPELAELEGLVLGLEQSLAARCADNP
jgi:hypothetical protein